ncbi:MAG: hypothetical protein ACHQ1H_13640 [Nitrososphaerales archaeon]|jgi:hypothetical protein
MDEHTGQEKGKTPNEKIKFHYMKSNLFRVLHVDGALGGVTPTGDIFFSMYNQRLPIPKITVQEVSAEGELGSELISERRTRDGIIREVEVGVIMTPSVAFQLKTWLEEKLKIVELVTEAQQKRTDEKHQKEVSEKDK